MNDGHERPLKVAMVQAEAYGKPASFDIERNLAYMLDLVERCCEEERPDVVLLPEVFTTPYFCSSHDERYFAYAETIPGPSTAALAERAKKYGCFIFAPLFEKVVDGEYYDSCALIAPTGELVPGRMPDGTELPCARKTHIAALHTSGTRTDEKYWFRPGAGLVNFHTERGVFGCLICYDRSFSEAWRTLVLAGAEVVFIPVVSYGFREELFIAELQTMSAENVVFTVACNRGGPEEVDFEVTMFGNSCVIDPTGRIVTRGGSKTGPELLSATIDLADVRKARMRIPYLRDRRPEIYVL